MNPFEPVATFVLGWMKQSLVGQWLRFLFELAFSAGVTFLFVCGSVMVATRSGILGIGFGMVAAAVSATALFRRESSKLTRGMLAILPSEEAAKELATDLQTIEKK
jgi:drug/metabolite transporter (DMT)-like permease